MSKRFTKYLIPTQGNEYKPHIFRGVVSIVLGILVVLTLIFSASTSILVRDSGLLAAIYPSILVDLANEARIEDNHQPLTVNEKLVQAAQLKANDMAEKGYFSHTSPEGLSPWYWIGLSGYQFIYAGENLAVDFTESTDVNRAWLNSPGHAENILSPDFTEIGIATAEGVYNGQKTIFVAQMFGTPAPHIQTTAGTTIADTQIGSSQPVADPVSTIEPEVVSEPDIEVLVETKLEDEKFIAVQNNEVSDDVVAEFGESGDVEPSAAPGYEQYSRWYDWVILNPAQTIEYALYVATALIALALILMFFVNINVQHPRNLLYGTVLLALLLLAIYLNRSGLVEEFVRMYFF